MNAPTHVIDSIKALEPQIRAIRKEYNISDHNQEVWQCPLSGFDEFLVVVADGLGGATLFWGDGPGYQNDNTMMLGSRDYASEKEAIARAMRCKEFDEDAGDLDVDELFDESIGDLPPDEEDFA
jgi:hypothetical protein